MFYVLIVFVLFEFSCCNFIVRGLGEGCLLKKNNNDCYFLMVILIIFSWYDFWFFIMFLYDSDIFVFVDMNVSFFCRLVVF